MQVALSFMDAPNVSDDVYYHNLFGNQFWKGKCKLFRDKGDVPGHLLTGMSHFFAQIELVFGIGSLLVWVVKGCGVFPCFL